MSDRNLGHIWPMYTLPTLSPEEVEALRTLLETRLGAVEGFERVFPITIGGFRIGFGDGMTGFSNEAANQIHSVLLAALEEVHPGSTQDNSPKFQNAVPVPREGWRINALQCEGLGVSSAGVSLVKPKEGGGVEGFTVTFAQEQRDSAVAFFRYLADHIAYVLRDNV